MKGVGYRAPHPIDHAESLVDVELDAPQPGPRDLLVRVRAVSVNPVDVKVRASAKPTGDGPRILGFDAAGIVEAVGPAVRGFAPGDEVFYAGAIDRPGTNSELHTVDERIVGPKPKSIGFADAASLPLTAITAWELLFERLHVPYGRKTGGGSILVVNGAGGVGSILVQIARRLTGLTVVATASRPESVGWVKAMGAHYAIDHHASIPAQLRELGMPAVDCIAGLTASDQHHATFLEVIAPQGRIALIDDPPSFDIVPFKRKSVSVAWELMFTRSLFTTPDIEEQGRLLTEISSLVDAGVLKPTTTRRLDRIDAASLREAHGIVESRRAIGKVVLEGW